LAFALSPTEKPQIKKTVGKAVFCLDYVDLLTEELATFFSFFFFHEFKDKLNDIDKCLHTVACKQNEMICFLGRDELKIICKKVELPKLLLKIAHR